MASQRWFEIQEDDEYLVVRFPKHLIGPEQRARFLAWLQLEEIRSRSELTEEDAATLADEVDAAVWEGNRFRVSRSADPATH